uniref:Uncharacterized protein n=1 Tax=Romanomermis culicivorax TaxID=13658 RepID=A0A915JNA0_ROMCU
MKAAQLIKNFHDKKSRTTHNSDHKPTCLDIEQIDQPEVVDVTGRCAPEYSGSILCGLSGKSLKFRHDVIKSQARKFSQSAFLLQTSSDELEAYKSHKTT